MSRSYAADHVVRLDHGGAISKAERNKLGAFLAEVAHNRPESLRIVVHGRANAAQERAITAALVADGVSPESIIWARGGHTGPAVPRGTVVLAIERAVAIAPNCLGYTGHPAAPEDNLPEPNLGCANAYNFAAMVGDPHHLSQGASSIYYSGQRGAADVAAYRERQGKAVASDQRRFHRCRSCWRWRGSAIAQPGFVYGSIIPQRMGLTRCGNQL